MSLEPEKKHVFCSTPPIAAIPSARISSAASNQSLHICMEGRVCERRRDSRSFRYPTHHVIVENRRRSPPKQSNLRHEMKGIATNTTQTRATTINHINRERVQCVGSPVSWRFCLLSSRRVPAYLFHEKIGSHNEYPYSEARSCQTRIRGTI